MRPRLPAALEVPLSDAATKQARRYTGMYGTALIYEAKTLAYHNAQEAVLVQDIDDAKRILTERNGTNDWKKLWGGIIGGGLFGAFLPGVATEMAKGPGINTVLLGIYIGCGVIGPLIIYLTHRK